MTLGINKKVGEAAWKLTFNFLCNFRSGCDVCHYVLFRVFVVSPEQVIVTQWKHELF